MKHKLRNPFPWLVMVAWGVACFLFFQLAYSYHFFYKEQNMLFLWSADYVASYQGIGWLARLAGDFLTQFYYYLYAGATILAGCLLLLGLLVYSSLTRLGVNRLLALVVASVLMTVEAWFHLRYDYSLGSTMIIVGWASLLRIAVMWRRRMFAAVTAVLLMPLGIWLFGAPNPGKLTAPNWEVEHLLAVDNEYRFGHYDRVVSLVEQEQKPLQEMVFFYNLVMAQRGELPDHLMRFVPNELGTFHRIGPDTPLYTIKDMNELYWALGDMTFTERAALMANVFSPTNRNVRMVKRLAETNLVSGDTLAARKYLRLLEQTFAYEEWARKAPHDPRYRQKALLSNKQDDIAVTDNSHAIMMQLLDSNPENTVALDYMLCSELLLKDIDNFKRDYDRYCSEHPRAKKLYQEALCIWLAGTEAPVEKWQQLIIMPEVFTRFQQYNQQRGSQQFRDTYWFYFDKAKTPQI